MKKIIGIRVFSLPLFVESQGSHITMLKVGIWSENMGIGWAGTHEK
jgi:hypothetical protein